MSGTPTRILLADDQDDVRSGFRLVLDSQPDTTVIGEAADGATALELAHPLRRASADRITRPRVA